MKFSLSLGSAGRIGVAGTLLLIGIVGACSATPDPGSQNRGPGQGGASSSVGAGPNGGTGVILPDAGSQGGARATVCDDAGNCTCVNVLVYGRLPTYGADPPGSDTTLAFQMYLNMRSSAAVSVVTMDTELTPEFLAGYDIIILQALENAESQPGWSITPQEVTNVQNWIMAGGGLMSLTGYGANAAEVTPTNALFQPYGLQYGTADIGATCPDGCCYCAGNSVPSGGWNTGHPISANITKFVGAFHGRPVMAPTDAQLVAGDGVNVFGATKQVGSGRVFMFYDEWVTYTSQWGMGIPPSVDMASCVQDMNNACYGRTASVYYQVPQFWFNTLLWLSGDRQCFDIDDPVIVK